MNDEIELPKVVRVGFRHYRIEAIDDIGHADGLNGLHLADMHVIRVGSRLPVSEQAMVLLYEIFHAVWNMDALDEAESVTEELVCRAFGNTLTQVWQDNPEVMEWIGKHASGK